MTFPRVWFIDVMDDGTAYGEVSRINFVDFTFSHSASTNTLTLTVPAGAWGSITGTLASQTDLSTALSGKAASSHTHAEGDVTGLAADLAAKAPLASPSFTTPAIGVATGTSLAVAGLLKTSSASGGLGFATGAGGTATQSSTRSTAVTVSPNPCMSGTITGDSTSLAAGAEAIFVVTNSAVTIGDVVMLSVQSGPTANTSVFSVSTVTAGTFSIRIRNLSATTADTGAPIINFAIIKAVSS